MPDKAQLGTRYSCFKCSCKFYDLNKPEPVCPRCGADQRDDPTPDPRVAMLSRYKTSRTPAAKVVAEPEDDFSDDDEEDDDDNSDDDEIEEDLDD